MPDPLPDEAPWFDSRPPRSAIDDVADNTAMLLDETRRTARSAESIELALREIREESGAAWATHFAKMNQILAAVKVTQAAAVIVCGVLAVWALLR